MITINEDVLAALVLKEFGVETMQSFDSWLLEDRASNWDDGARQGGRYGHEDGWYNGGPHRDNPYRTEQEILDTYGEDEW